MTVNCYYVAMKTEKYTIQELSELTGFTRRTIRYYIQEGLLEAPAGRGRGGFYFDSHLQRLYHIKALQDRGLKLSAISEMLTTGPVPEISVQRGVYVRHEIAPGVELHIDRHLEEESGRDIAEVIRIARSILARRRR
jgi:DNA-binding transcriptional MerR regulator